MTDVSQYGNNGSCSGSTCPVWNSSGNYGGAFTLDGVDDYLETVNNLSISGDQTRTVLLWFNPGSKQGAQEIFSFGAVDSAKMFGLVYDLYLADEGVYFTGYAADAAGQINTINRDSWNFVAVTYNGTWVKVYLNGNTTPDIESAVTLSTTDSTFYIGKSKEDLYEFEGSIDEVRIYNRSLSADEIQQQYYSNLNKYDTNNWQFYSNESNLTNATYSYFSFFNYSSGNENCTETRTLTMSTTVIANESSETSNLSEWRMFQRYLNHTAWDGVSSQVIAGLNQANFTTGGAIYSSSTIANGYVYVGSNDGNLYQFNASNISQEIASFTTSGTGDTIFSSPAVANGYVYVGSNDGNLYQLNASNISGTYTDPSTFIANFTTGNSIESSPVIANDSVGIFSVYVGSFDGKLYRLNASNVSQEFASFTTGDTIFSSPAVANGFVYFGSVDGVVYQLNASDITQQIANFTTGGAVYSSPALANGYAYIGSNDGNIYQLNASDISQQITNFTTSGSVRSSPAVTNDYVYVGGIDGNVYQLNSSNISLENPDLIPPVIDFSLPTPADAITTANTSAAINVSINESNLDTFRWNFNGTNYTFYNNSIALMFGFNNVVALGENSGGIVDISNGSFSGSIENGVNLVDGIWRRESFF
ncbi:PQQ-binding-like beta-propeller repeat protein [Candidatus Micrarchaeota archaeon]|nr:PQQ-binding-like beta-propeller repeat protein [Candidatus Micrarchaeota archaeon]